MRWRLNFSLNSAVTMTIIFLEESKACHFVPFMFQFSVMVLRGETWEKQAS